MLSEDKILHILFSGLFLVFLFERGSFQAKAMLVSGEARNIRENKRKVVTVIVLFLVAQLWVLGSFIFIINPTAMELTLIPLPTWVRRVGVFLTLFGMAFEFVTQLYLGRNYSTTVHIRPEQSLVTSGPYRYIRHPMYTALITVGVGLGLLSASWYFLVPFIAIGIVIVFRIPREEAVMVRKFGDEYFRYAQRTGRFLPKLRRKETTPANEH
jgi:protein-S-isoprenylcysteine O-methyltransferase Ste14